MRTPQVSHSQKIQGPPLPVALCPLSSSSLIPAEAPSKATQKSLSSNQKEQPPCLLKPPTLKLQTQINACSQTKTALFLKGTLIR